MGTGNGSTNPVTVQRFRSPLTPPARSGERGNITIARDEYFVVLTVTDLGCLPAPGPVAGSPQTNSEEQLVTACTWSQIAGIHIKDVRVSRGLTVEALAEMMKITVEDLSAYEAGELLMTAPRLRQFADVLKVHIFDLLEGPGRTRTPYQIK